jgi:hypothetical protein
VGRERFLLAQNYVIRFGLSALIGVPGQTLVAFAQHLTVSPPFADSVNLPLAILNLQWQN